MIPLSPKAQQHLDRYLDDMRRSLRGHESLDPDDIEQDVLDHIDHELRESAAPPPIDESQIQAVLERLGSPRQWVPQNEVSPWRRFVLSLRHGPEDWRLAYLSLGAFILTLLSVRMGRLPFMLISVSGFVLARAAAEAATGEQELGAQRWLFYPSLLLVYVPLAILIVFGPAILATNLTPIATLHHRVSPDGLMMFRSEQWPHWLMPWSAGRQPGWLARSALLGRSPAECHALYALAVGGLVGGVWWLALGLIVRLAPRLPGRIFYPIMGQLGTERDGRKVLFSLVIAGAVTMVASAAVMYLLP